MAPHHGRAEWHGLGVPGSGSLDDSARAVLSSTLEEGLLARPCAIARPGHARLWKSGAICSTGVLQRAQARIAPSMRAQACGLARAGACAPLTLCYFSLVLSTGVQISTGWPC
ncbi:hypothetical protein JCGZ_22812 [Jatropha curcas]|uniref:Uncharacterized protein n=1 Tax=Jatropha curcas TaxID=180498 RepID=A0A067LFJ9_JATCU|nr:hypothetical protein JCGZ_22812 [Jatropha curcas]